MWGFKELRRRSPRINHSCNQKLLTSMEEELLRPSLPRSLWSRISRSLNKQLLQLRTHQCRASNNRGRQFSMSYLLLTNKRCRGTWRNSKKIWLLINFKESLHLCWQTQSSSMSTLRLLIHSFRLITNRTLKSKRKRKIIHPPIHLARLSVNSMILLSFSWPSHPPWLKAEKSNMRNFSSRSNNASLVRRLS